jgi:hypothetical protein
MRDNHTRGAVADFLKEKIKDGTTLSVVSAYSTIYAFDELKQVLSRIDHLNFFFGEPTFVNRFDPSKPDRKAFIVDADGLEPANKPEQKRVARVSGPLKQRVDIRTIQQSAVAR